MSVSGDLCDLLRNAENAVKTFRDSSAGLSDMATCYDVDGMLSIEASRDAHLKRIQTILQIIETLCHESGSNTLEQYIDAQELSADKKAHIQEMRSRFAHELNQMQQSNMNDMLHILAARQVAQSLLVESGLHKVPITYGPVK